MDEIVKGELREIQSESAIKAEFIPLSETEFIVKCKIIENNITVFEIQTLANSREQAVKIVRNWEERTEEIYPKVIEMLNQEIIENDQEDTKEEQIGLEMEEN